ncbi:nucleotidyltransferase domain-containing protein [Microlunatus speluncae]|uniref:nucleotidyltransferase domain-containing protein n=1 Tax=Microlunatus speluncae TaxID=2594267 RepID=UPI0012665DA8|nr:nucleotidyltransferase domain-containing protein [Microlunatus speluncae]
MPDDFLPALADRLAALPGVTAVALGGSRAQDQHAPDADYDLGLYYGGRFDPQDLRDCGWPGEVSELGGWGGGLFNGGGWLTVDGRRVDVHYRDLDVIESIMAEAEQGRFTIEPLLFHLAGIPSYLLLAELAINRTLVGDLPRPTFPAALRESAPRDWWGRAQLILGYAIDGAARAGRSTLAIGLTAQAITCAAHAIVAARGRWVTNEKRLLSAAGLTDVDRMITDLSPDPATAVSMIERIRDRCAAELAVSSVP